MIYLLAISAALAVAAWATWAWRTRERFVYHDKRNPLDFLQPVEFVMPCAICGRPARGIGVWEPSVVYKHQSCVVGGDGHGLWTRRKP
jgi:hypothetical protein